MREQVFCGAAFHAPERGRIEAHARLAITVDAEGVITEVKAEHEEGFEALVEAARAEGRLHEARAADVLMPGFVDTHIHAPQWPQLGKALDEPLEVWLQKYTFPLEARYADPDFAREVYADLVESLLAQGTTTGVYFATIHTEASLILGETCRALGQRAFVGRVAMDDPEQCPEYYRDASPEAGVEATRDFIARLRAGESGAEPLVRPIITPRFIPSCTDALLAGLGALAEETGCIVQTHCSESDWEAGYVQARHGKSDSEVLRDFGLLRDHTVLAHSNFVSQGDLEVIREAGAMVAHCPLSNVYFAKAAFPLRRALDMAVRVGLGTDISGGHSPSMFDSCCHALTVGRSRASGTDPATAPEARGTGEGVVTLAEAFWVATAGGGEALGLKVGKFEPGYRFDALLVATDRKASGLRIWDGLDAPSDTAEKIVLNARRDDIAAVWVDGRKVKGAA